MLLSQILIFGKKSDSQPFIEPKAIYMITVTKQRKIENGLVYFQCSILTTFKSFILNSFLFGK